LLEAEVEGHSKSTKMKLERIKQVLKIELENKLAIIQSVIRQERDSLKELVANSISEKLA